MTLSIRRAIADDLPFLAQMNKRLIEDERHRNPMSLAELEQRMRTWLEGSWNVNVFLDQGTIVGYAVHQARPDELYPDATIVELRQFFIERHYRSRGWGTSAFKMLSEAVFSKGAVIILDVLIANPRGQRFWERLGFRLYSTRMTLSV